MPKLYTRNQGGNLRYYADLRDLGGGQVALKPPGSSRATTDEIEAHKLLASKIEEIQGKVAASGSARLKPFMDEFIRQNPGEVTEQWSAGSENPIGGSRQLPRPLHAHGGGVCHHLREILSATVPLVTSRGLKDVRHRCSRWGDDDEDFRNADHGEQYPKRKRRVRIASLQTTLPPTRSPQRAVPPKGVLFA